MSTPSRRVFLGQSIAFGTIAVTNVLLNNNCTRPAEYFPPTGVSRVLTGPVIHLQAFSLRPNRIDLIFYAGGQLRHKWLEVISPGVHFWGPDETSLGAPLGVYEYPAPVVVDGKLMLFATSGIPRTVSLRMYDLDRGWSDWLGLPGVNLARVVAFNSGGSNVRVVGLDDTFRLVTTELSSVHTAPQAWREIRSYGGGGRHEWIKAITLGRDSGSQTVRTYEHWRISPRKCELGCVGCGR